MGEKHIADQRALISRLERDELDATEAKGLLQYLEETQALHVAEGDRPLQALRELGA